MLTILGLNLNLGLDLENKINSFSFKSFTILMKMGSFKDQRIVSKTKWVISVNAVDLIESRLKDFHIRYKRPAP